MKYIPSFPVSSLHGKVQNTPGMYFRRSGGIGIFQKGRVDSPPGSPGLAFTQALFQESKVAWDALTNPQKADWNSWVTTEKPLTLERKEYISGFNAFRGLYQIAEGGRLTPATTAPTTPTASRVGSLNYLRWHTGLGRWVIQGLAETTAEVNSKLMFECTTPRSSSQIAYSKNDLSLIARVDLEGSIRETTGGSAWGLFFDNPTKDLQVGLWCWVRLTLWSPDWWPANQIAVKTQITSV